MAWYNEVFTPITLINPRSLSRTQNNSFLCKLLVFVVENVEDFGEHQLFPVWSAHLYLDNYLSQVHRILVGLSVMSVSSPRPRCKRWPRLDRESPWGIHIVQQKPPKAPSPSPGTRLTFPSASLEWLLVLFSAPWSVPIEDEVNSEDRAKRLRERQNFDAIIWSFRPSCDRSPPSDFLVVWVHCFPPFFFFLLKVLCVVWSITC